MKEIPITALLFIFAGILFGQQTQFLTYTSNMRIIGVKNGEPFEWENKNISVRLNYQTGEFISHLKNSDFLNTEIISTTENDTINERLFTLSGTFPISDIINQQQQNQNYGIELQLINDDLDLSKSLLFDMTITRPESSDNRSYRIFNLKGILYNDDLNLPAFVDFDNEIQIWLMFSGFMNTR